MMRWSRKKTPVGPETAEVLLRHYEVSNTGTEERLAELWALVKGKEE